MPSRVLQLPLKLGRLVRHRSDPTKAVGIIVGWQFDPPGALVRWQYGASAYEDPATLEDLARAPSDLWFLGDEVKSAVLPAAHRSAAERRSGAIVRLSM